MAKYGLVGKNIDYSFSKQFFTQKFKKERRKDSYENFDLECIDLLPHIRHAKAATTKMGYRVLWQQLHSKNVGCSRR